MANDLEAEAEAELPKSLFDSNDKVVQKYLEKIYKRSRAPISDTSTLAEFLTRPDQSLGSKYSAVIPKNVSLANLNDKGLDRKIILKWARVINRAEFMTEQGWVNKDLYEEVHAELIYFLDATRAEGMKHEKLLAENTLNVNKIEKSDNASTSNFGVLNRR